MHARQIWYLTVAILGAVVGGLVYGQAATGSLGGKGATEQEHDSDYSGEYCMVAFDGRRPVSSGTANLSFGKDGAVSGSWELDYEKTLGDREGTRYPIGSGQIVGDLDDQSYTIWLDFQGGGSLGFRGVVHAREDQFTVFRGSWSYSGLVGLTYGGLLEIAACKSEVVHNPALTLQ